MRIIDYNTLLIEGETSMKKSNKAEKEITNIEENKTTSSHNVSIIILSVFIGVLVVLSFFLSKNSYEITTGIVICISLIVVVVLSQYFDNLSIPKVITLSKNLKNAENEKNKLQEQNIELVKQIVNVKMTNQQSSYMNVQLNTDNNISAVNDKEKDELDGECNSEEDNKNTRITNKVSSSHVSDMEFSRYRRAIKSFVLLKYLNKSNYDAKYNVRLSINDGLDSVSKKMSVCFDALCESDIKCDFIDVILCIPSILSRRYLYELYYKMDNVKKYRFSNNSLANIVLVVPTFDKSLENISSSFRNSDFILSQIKNMFENEILTGLLTIKQVNISKDELDKYISESYNKKD